MDPVLDLKFSGTITPYWESNYLHTPWGVREDNHYGKNPENS
jgi:hypothetical protein